MHWTQLTKEERDLTSMLQPTAAIAARHEFKGTAYNVETALGTAEHSETTRRENPVGS
jgi:hypothetical protein